MIPIDQYAYVNRLATVHPLEKMAFSFVFLLFAISTKDVLISLITFFVMSVFILIAAKIPLITYLKLLLLPGFFLLSSLAGILISFTTATHLPSHVADWTVFGVTIFIGTASIHTAYHLFFSVLASISCLYFLTLTTPITAITYTMRKLKFPIVFVDLCELTYRFIFVFLASMQRIYQAQQSRLGYQNKKRWIQSIGFLITSMFKDVFKRAHELNNAMQARCYDDTITDTLYGYSVCRRNWYGVAACLCGLFIIYFTLGGLLT